MTLNELIYALQKHREEFPQDADREVSTEGCDCDGPANRVDREKEEWGGGAYIRRQ